MKNKILVRSILRCAVLTLLCLPLFTACVTDASIEERRVELTAPQQRAAASAEALTAQASEGKIVPAMPDSEYAALVKLYPTFTGPLGAETQLCGVYRDPYESLCCYNDGTSVCCCHYSPRTYCSCRRIPTDGDPTSPF